MADTINTNAVLVALNINIWSGAARLEELDLDPSTRAGIPPRELASMGVKKVYNPDLIKPFRMLKARAIRACDAVGVKRLSGWMVDKTLLPTLEADLQAIRQDWDSEMVAFLASYDDNADTWAQSSGQWEGVIRAGQPSRADMPRKFGMSWQTWEVVPVESQASGNDTSEEVKGLGDKAIEAVLADLTELRRRSFSVAQPSGKAYKALEKIADKARALGFAHPRAATLGDVLTMVSGSRNDRLTRLVFAMCDNVPNVIRMLDDMGLEQSGLQGVAAWVNGGGSYPITEVATGRMVEPTPVPEPVSVSPAVGALVDMIETARPVDDPAPDSVLTDEERAMLDNDTAIIEAAEGVLEDVLPSTSLREPVSETKPAPEPAPEPEPVDNERANALVMDSWGLF